MARGNYSLDEPLPASGMKARDLGFDGVTVKDNEYGGKHVSCWKGDDEYNSRYRYSYDTDQNGNYVPRTAHYTDNMSEVFKKMGHDRW